MALFICPSTSARSRPAGGWLNRLHRFEPRRGQFDCHLLFFTSDLDPTVFTHASQHHLTHRNGQVSGDLPIVQVETLQNRSLSHVRDFSRIFASHSLDRTRLLPRHTVYDRLG
jgi:hypothetical protein